MPLVLIIILFPTLILVPITIMLVPIIIILVPTLFLIIPVTRIHIRPFIIGTLRSLAIEMTIFIAFKAPYLIMII